jgi:hypothetical protein
MAFQIKMNRKSLELAISTFVIIVLGILVLIGLIYFVTDGFKSFRSSTNPFISAAEESGVKAACENACSNELKMTFCCVNHTVNDEIIKCNDSRLDINCQKIDCNTFSC